MATSSQSQGTWKEVSMDFNVELSKSMENTVIWVITNLFSKQVHLPSNPVCTHFGKILCVAIYQLHEPPRQIISDRGVQFTFHICQEFLKLLGPHKAQFFPSSGDKWRL